MTAERLSRLLAALALWLGACSLDPPPPPRPIDCAGDRAAERYPDECDDGGTESSGEDE